MTWIIETDLLGIGGRGQDLTHARKSMRKDAPSSGWAEGSVEWL